MKIAYLFHGHSRTWKDCYQSFFDNVYSVAPGDIFIHTWDRVNSKFGSFWNNNLGLNTEEAERISSKTLDLEGIIKAYNPKHIVVESDKGLETAMIECPKIFTTQASHSHIGAYNMVKGQHSVFKISEQYGEYDRYFSCRMDILFENKLDPKELEYENCMIVPPTFEDGMYDSPEVTAIWDIFALGTKKDIETRSKFYFHIWDYWFSKNNLDVYFIEHAATKYYKDNNIIAKPSKMNVQLKRLF